MTKVEKLVEALSSQFEHMIQSKDSFAVELNSLLDIYDYFINSYFLDTGSRFSLTKADQNSLQKKSHQIYWFNEKRPLIRFSRRMIQQSDQIQYARFVIENNNIKNLKTFKRQLIKSRNSLSGKDKFFLSYCNKTISIFLNRLGKRTIGINTEANVKLEILKEMYNLCSGFACYNIGNLPNYYTKTRKESFKNNSQTQPPIIYKESSDASFTETLPLPPFKPHAKLVKLVLHNKEFNRKLAAKSVKCCTKTISNYLKELKRYQFENSKLFWAIIDRDN